ncbi:PDZ domain-containing protein [Armatimonas sp.]|uniref:PDZ domain-containing protein n=1 Tax=Armatimonas sp. TaxID=1872638 RepID=UPI0037538B31
MRELSWRTDCGAAFTEAKIQHKLLFVLFACPRAKNAPPILRGENPTLARLLTEHFVPVHLASLKDIDLNLFRFDYDRQLMGLVLTPEGNTLARWGGEDISMRSLLSFLERVKSLERSAPKPQAPQTLAQKFPAFAQTKRAKEVCYHCHYAHDAEIEQQRRTGTFQKLSLYRYPPPSLLGLTLGDDNQITAIAPGSPAAKAGLKVGERLTQLNKQPLITAADLSFALDALPESARSISLNGKRLALASGWRAYDISARPSQGIVPPLFGFWEEPIPSSKTLALKVTLLFSGERWRASQGDLQLGDTIVAVDGKTLPQMSASQFHTWLRMNKDVGQKLRLTIIREGKRLLLTLPCLDIVF